MTKQELKELLGDEYPISEGLEARLVERLRIFPGAIKVYARNPERIFYRSNEWFLVEQLNPDLVSNPYAKVSVNTHMENIVQGRKVQDINWVSIYEFVDTCLEDGYMKRLLNKIVNDYYNHNLISFKTGTNFLVPLNHYREFLLENPYDIV